MVFREALLVPGCVAIRRKFWCGGHQKFENSKYPELATTTVCANILIYPLFIMLA